MKLARIGVEGAEKPCIYHEGAYYDVSSRFADFNESFFQQNGLAELAKLNPADFPVVSGRLGACVARPSKIVCVGLNYADHAKETGAEIPKEPILFFKSTTALSGPNDDIIIPKNSTKTDWEVELAIVIGKKASYVSEEEAYDYVAGYCLHNDLSEGRYRHNGLTIELDDIKLPMFVLATERDHVSPWTSVYKIHRLVMSPVTFVLTTGGHNVGIVNPPSGPSAHPRSSYREFTHALGKAPADPQIWLRTAPSHSGSWWPTWDNWLRKHSSREVDAAPVGGLAHESGTLAAPGSYVHQG